jgi:hypothetical protein
MKELTVRDFENKTLIEIFSMLGNKPMSNDIIIHIHKNKIRG